MTHELIIKSASEAELEQAAREFVNHLGNSTVITFTGTLGAGKTTFISAVCRLLGVEGEEISSPSFSIVNEYRSETTAELIYHFDLYRLKDSEEAIDAGIEDYFDSGALCLVEWPEIAEDLLPDDTVRVSVEAMPDGTRKLSVTTPE